MEADKAIDISATASNNVDKSNKNATNEKPLLQAKSIIDMEVEKFRDMSRGWWSHSTTAYALYTMNQIRVPYVVEKAKEAGIIREEFAETATPLKGLKVLDVGCGGGCKTKEVRGMAMNPFTKNWFWIWTTQVLYSSYAIKTKN